MVRISIVIKEQRRNNFKIWLLKYDTTFYRSLFLEKNQKFFSLEWLNFFFRHSRECLMLSAKKKIWFFFWYFYMIFTKIFKSYKISWYIKALKNSYYLKSKRYFQNTFLKNIYFIPYKNLINFSVLRKCLLIDNFHNRKFNFEEIGYFQKLHGIF